MWPFVFILALALQVDHRTPVNPVVGMLEMRELFGEYPCDRFVPEPVDVHVGPSAASVRVGVIETTKHWYADDQSDCEWIEVGLRSQATGEVTGLRFMEYSYEEPGLVVVERRDDWFRIGSDESIGWIQSRDPSKFHSYQNLVQESLSYLTDAWPGGFWPSPGASDPIAVPTEWQAYTANETMIVVLESAVVQNELWFRVRLDPDYGCGRVTAALPVVEGWVLAYSPTGSPQIWFHSRGC